MSYWERLLDTSDQITTDQLLEAKTDMMNYRLPFSMWKAVTPWWGDETDLSLREVYESGQAALKLFEETTLREWCEKRLHQIANRQSDN